MRKSKDNNQTSLLANLYCDADLCSPEFITPDEKMLVREPCCGGNRGIVDCRSVFLSEYISDAGGLDFETKPILTRTPVLTSDLVVIPSDCFGWSPDSFPEIVGINIKDILSSKPRLRWGHYQIKDDVHIDLSALQRSAFQNKKVVLFSSYIDVAIEKLWFERNDISLFRDIAKANFYAVTGMNFSLFLHECPIGQLINLNKSLTYVHELSKLGVPVIPHVYAVNDRQRSKLADYINDNPNATVVTINTQLQRDSFSIHEAIKTIEYLVDNTSCRVIINGKKIKPAVSDPSRIIIANQNGLKWRAITEKARGRLSAQQTSLGAG